MRKKRELSDVTLSTKAMKIYKKWETYALCTQYVAYNLTLTFTVAFLATVDTPWLKRPRWLYYNFGI